jgi:hypothetical protein
VSIIPPSAFGKMNALGSASGLSSFHDRRPSFNPSGIWTLPRLFGVLPKGLNIGALAHLQLARAPVMMGDQSAARKSYVDFLALWKDADPDIPLYKEAKAEYSRVAE